ncbi:hypothetical protein FQZ97_960640 [compost metagenome]
MVVAALSPADDPGRDPGSNRSRNDPANPAYNGRGSLQQRKELLDRHLAVVEAHIRRWQRLDSPLFVGLEVRDRHDAIPTPAHFGGSLGHIGSLGIASIGAPLAAHCHRPDKDIRARHWRRSEVRQVKPPRLNPEATAHAVEDSSGSIAHDNGRLGRWQ